MHALSWKLQWQWIPDSCEGMFVGEEETLHCKQKTIKPSVRYVFSQMCITLLLFIEKCCGVYR